MLHEAQCNDQAPYGTERFKSSKLLYNLCLQTSTGHNENLAHIFSAVKAALLQSPMHHWTFWQSQVLQEEVR